MAKLKVKASELKDVKVDFVSLVKRGANRIPFRVLKEDDAMSLDLGSFFLKKADAAEAERVSARKSEDMIKAAAEVLTKAGYTIARKAINDENTAGGPRDDGDGSSDEANPATGADAGGPRNDGTSSGGTPAANPAANSDAGGMRDDGATLPAPVQPIAKAENPAKEMPQNLEGAGAGDGTTEDSTNPNERTTTVKDGAADNSAPSDPMGGEMEKSATKMKKAEEDMRAALQKAETAYVENTKKLTDLVKTMGEQVTTMQTQVTDMAARVKKSETTLAALVPGQAAPDLNVSVRKGDTHIPLLDTGYSNSRI